MFNRIDSLIGMDKRKNIQKKTVLVIGLGGVGSFAVESLIRNGIENIIIVDYDIVDKTNLNRQLIALNSTIGRKKVDVLENRIKDINNESNVIKIDKLIDKNNYLELFNYKFDYLIDACDTIETKKLLIKECLNKKIKFISCMGTARKLDPTKLDIMEINKTSYDKIAKILRKWTKEEKIKGKIMVVSSNEEIKKCSDSNLGSMMFVPSVAGILCSKYVIDDIIKKDII